MARGGKPRKEKFRAAVVGEGITEWHYFYSLKQTEKLPYQLKPSLPKHSDYREIFKKAQQLAAEGYDQVYCVIDLDVIQSLDSKAQGRYEKAKSKLLRNPDIFAFETMPCTEYWFLLHYCDYSTRIYPDYESVAAELFRFLPDYEKSNAYFQRIKIYTTLKSTGDMEKAQDTAQRLCAKRVEQDNPLFPFSEFGELIGVLFSRR